MASARNWDASSSREEPTVFLMLISLVRFSARAIARFVKLIQATTRINKARLHEDIHRRDQTSTVQRIQVAAGDRTEREDVFHAGLCSFMIPAIFLSTSSGELCSRRST